MSNVAAREQSSPAPIPASGKPTGLAHNEAVDGAALGSESHAHPDLSGALADGVGDHPVEANNAEQQGESSESADDPGGRTVQSGVRRVVQALAHSDGIEDGESGIDAVNRCRRLGQQGVFLLRSAEDDAKITDGFLG